MSRLLGHDRIVLTLFIIGALIVPSTVAYTSWTSERDQHRSCLEQNQTRDAVLDVFHLIRDVSPPPKTSEERTAAVEFFKAVDKKLAPLNC